MISKAIVGIIFLPIILFIGCITSCEDFFVSKIRNKWILTGMLYVLIVYFLSWALYVLAWGKFISPKIGYIVSYLVWNFDKWCINLVISILIAYLLWYFKMWAAGDAKLFICYSALIPMGQYSKVYFNYYFASFLLLLATFIPATIFLLLKSATYFIRRFNLYQIKENMLKLIKGKLTKFNKIEAGKVLFGFFVLFLSFRILRQQIMNLIGKVLFNQNVLILISLLAFRFFSKAFKRGFKFTVIIFIILSIYLGFKMMHSPKELISEMRSVFGWTLFFMMVLFPLFERIVSLYTERTTQKTTPFAIWMFLGALITWFL